MTVVTGAVRSILTAGALWALVELPALSVTLAPAVSAEPSPVMVLLAGTAPARPESASDAVHATVTSLLYQPFALGAVVGVPESVGAALSMLMPLTVVLVELSALSTAVPVTDWFAPLVETTTGETGCVLMPERPSLAVKVTVTSVLFQPLALAVGVRDPVIVGVLLSSLTVADPVPEFPRLSVTVVVRVT